VVEVERMVGDQTRARVILVIAVFGRRPAQILLEKEVARIPGAGLIGRRECRCPIAWVTGEIFLLLSNHRPVIVTPGTNRLPPARQTRRRLWL
jgi:hypothetical protein